MTTLTLSDSAKAIAALQPELDKANDDIMRKLEYLFCVQSDLRELIVYRDSLEHSIRTIADLIGKTQ